MSKIRIDYRNGVELWEIPHPSDPNERAYLVADPKRTVETWSFSSGTQANDFFADRIEISKGKPSGS